MRDKHASPQAQTKAVHSHQGNTVDRMQRSLIEEDKEVLVMRTQKRMESIRSIDKQG